MTRSNRCIGARDRHVPLLSVLPLALVTGCGGSGGGARQPSLETPSIAVSGVEVDEGDSGTTPAVFHITLSTPGSEPVTAEWSTLEGTASSGKDYRPTSGKFVIEPGTMDTVVVVDVMGDRSEEPDETFFLVIESPRGANLEVAEAMARATVRDNDEEEGDDTAGDEDEDDTGRSRKTTSTDDDGGQKSTRHGRGKPGKHESDG